MLTCLDNESRPVVTHAFLRILSKLESKWHRKDEYGVPIDLVGGRLGAMCSDRLTSCAGRFSRSSALWHRQGIGRRALGPLLQHPLAALARSHDVD